MLTYVTKSNAMRNGMVLWDEAIIEVSKEFPDVVCFYLTVWVGHRTHGNDLQLTSENGPHAR
jgi:hypothetical protein